jgi:hypothetical protein
MLVRVSRTRVPCGESQWGFRLSVYDSGKPVLEAEVCNVYEYGFRLGEEVREMLVEAERVVVSGEDAYIYMRTDPSVLSFYRKQVGG